MKTLHLTLKKQWFDMIAGGEKKEEYREIKPYWVKRFNAVFVHTGEWSYNPILDTKHFEIVSANNGYAKDCPNVKWQHKGIRIGEGKLEWGAAPGIKYFILEIGEIIK